MYLKTDTASVTMVLDQAESSKQETKLKSAAVSLNPIQQPKCGHEYASDVVYLK